MPTTIRIITNVGNAACEEEIIEAELGMLIIELRILYKLLSLESINTFVQFRNTILHFRLIDPECGGANSDMHEFEPQHVYNGSYVSTLTSLSIQYQKREVQPMFAAYNVKERSVDGIDQC